MELVLIGLLGRPHGLRGEISLDRTTLSPDELERIRVFTWRGRGRQPERELTLESVRPTHDRILIRFSGVIDRDQAAVLTRGELLADRAALPDPGPEMAYTFQLVGLRVIEVSGRELGVVTEIMRTGAHPVWVVRGDRELLVPANPSVIRHVDLEAGVATVALPAGLEDL
jgi:16S rRNA processing protein RimM